MAQAIDIFPWDDNFATGIAVVDDQHKKLVVLLNLLASHVAFRSDSIQLSKIIDDLIDYTRYHFETEERIWGSFLCGHELEVGHKAAHHGFIETVLRLRAEQGSRPLEQIAEEALGFLARWLASHILESDRYMAYLVSALDEGLAVVAAQARAQEKMSGATRVLINIILSIYETLSTNTLHLMREIAERKAREIDLIQARLSAEAASVAKSQFLYNMTHELHTPLNGIMGAAQLMQQVSLDDDDRKACLATILDCGAQLHNLCNDLLNLSDVETGALAIDAAPFEPRSLIHEIQERYFQATQSKGLQLETSVEDWVIGQCVGDVHRVRQMLTHLMSNAIKFTEAGRIRVALREIEREEGRALLEFSVSDTGIGLDPVAGSRLFQPFCQVDGGITRRYGGTGVGLSVVRNLAELMGGSVGVESLPGHGSTFWFRIRVAEVAPAK